MADRDPSEVTTDVVTLRLRDGTTLVLDVTYEDPAPARKTPAPARRRAVCANCDSQFTPPDGRLRPFCSLRCKSTARAVRYLRSLLARQPEIRFLGLPYEARIKIGHALAGGYAASHRRLSAGTRAAVIERDNGRCVLCGEPGAEIDHIAGDSDDLSNLRLLCAADHQAITETRLVPITDPEIDRAWRDILRRGFAAQPERACDAADWDTRWRAWLGRETAAEV